jgi:SSS family solute:Na+ symporter
MAQNFWTAVYAFTACFIITVLISVTTKQLKTNEQLTGLVWALTPRIKEEGVRWFRSPEILAVIVGAIAIAFTIYWW